MKFINSWHIFQEIRRFETKRIISQTCTWTWACPNICDAEEQVAGGSSEPHENTPPAIRSSVCTSKSRIGGSPSTKACALVHRQQILRCLQGHGTHSLTKHLAELGVHPFVSFILNLFRNKGRHQSLNALSSMEGKHLFPREFTHWSLSHPKGPAEWNENFLHTQGTQLL